MSLESQCVTSVVCYVVKTMFGREKFCNIVSCVCSLITKATHM